MGVHTVGENISRWIKLCRGAIAEFLNKRKEYFTFAGIEQQTDQISWFAQHPQPRRENHEGLGGPARCRGPGRTRQHVLCVAPLRFF